MGPPAARCVYAAERAACSNSDTVIAFMFCCVSPRAPSLTPAPGRVDLADLTTLIRQLLAYTRGLGDCYRTIHLGIAEYLGSVGCTSRRSDKFRICFVCVCAERESWKERARAIVSSSKPKVRADRSRGIAEARSCARVRSSTQSVARSGVPDAAAVKDLACSA